MDGAWAQPPPSFRGSSKGAKSSRAKDPPPGPAPTVSPCVARGPRGSLPEPEGLARRGCSAATVHYQPIACPFSPSRWIRPSVGGAYALAVRSNQGRTQLHPRPCRERRGPRRLRATSLRRWARPRGTSCGGCGSAGTSGRCHWAARCTHLRTARRRSERCCGTPSSWPEECPSGLLSVSRGGAGSPRQHEKPLWAGSPVHSAALAPAGSPPCADARSVAGQETSARGVGAGWQRGHSR